MATSGGFYDLIVVGGGPAGSSAARRAGKRGLRALLVEKAAFPRDKPCGGALSGLARTFLDFDLPAELCGSEIIGARAHYRGRSVECRTPFPLVTTITRSLFDDCLLQKAREAGAEVKVGEKALGFTEGPDGIEVQTDQGAYRGRFLVLAEGAQGRLTRRVRPKDPPKAFAVCLVTEVELGEEAVAARCGGIADIHFGLVRGGYGWVFPHRRHLNVGLGGRADGLHDLKQRMAAFLAAEGLEPTRPLRAHVVPMGGRRRRIVRGRVLLCGDAAGFVDAWTGEGIAHAIRSGQVAADTVADVASGDGEPKGLAAYAAACHREFGRNLRDTLLLATLLHRSWGLGYRILAGSARALGKTLEVPGGKATPGQVVRWLLPRLPLLLLGGLRG